MDWFNTTTIILGCPTWFHCNQHITIPGAEITQCSVMSYSGDLGYAFCITEIKTLKKCLGITVDPHGSAEPSFRKLG